ncbi:uncharacterized protein LOC144886747 [Branchiostoma floridae x Branchiostoma japonicum]
MRTVAIIVLVLLAVVNASFTQENSLRSGLGKKKTTKQDLLDMNSAVRYNGSVDGHDGREIHRSMPTVFGHFMAQEERNETLPHPKGEEIQAGCSIATVKNVAISLICSHKQSDRYNTAALLSTCMETAGQRLTEERQHFGAMPCQTNSVTTFARYLPVPHMFYFSKLSMLCALSMKVAFLLPSSIVTLLIFIMLVQLLFRSKYMEYVVDQCFSRFVLRFLLISVGILVLNGVFLLIGFTACFVYETVTIVCQEQNSKCRVYKCVFEYPVKVLWLLLRELNNTKGQPPFIHSSLRIRCRRNG